MSVHVASTNQTWNGVSACPSSTHREPRPRSVHSPPTISTPSSNSLLAWEPAFVSFENILGTSIFNHMYQPDWRTAQTKAVRSTCLDETAEALVATTTDGVVTGFVVLKEDHEESLGVIEMIAVHPLHQRQGFARLLLEFAIERLTKQGLRMINVGTGGDPGHAPARALYEAVGFTQLPLASYFLVVNNQP